MSANVDFNAFTPDKYFWYGTHRVPWLALDASFIIHADPKDAIPPTQREIVEFVYKLPAETRDKLEGFLFARYQVEIFGSIDPEECTPRIQKSSEIWNLVSSPGIHTPPDHRIEPDCYFEVTFECVWDDEHGIAVLFNNRGEPIDLGGQGSHF